MVGKRSSEPFLRRIFLFGGQGSTTTFLSGPATASEDAVKSSAEAATLLSRCHAVFLEDLCSIEKEAYEAISIEKGLFSDPHSLLCPSEHYRTNGIIQGVTLLIHQLLHYIAYVEKSGQHFGAVFEEIEEVTGLCSGMIPALVVASSQNVQEFIHHGVEAVRLVFWVGFHSVLRSSKESGGGFNDQHWLLKLSGVNHSDLEQQLDSYCTKVSSPLDLSSESLRIRLPMKQSMATALCPILSLGRTLPVLFCITVLAFFFNLIITHS